MEVESMTPPFPKPTKRAIREVALLLLYQWDRNPDSPSGWERRYASARLRHGKATQNALALLQGVREQLPTIDEMIGNAALNWKVRRMAAIDRSLLRLAVYEMAAAEQRLAPGIAINEALELAKVYSSKESVAFLNGILDRIARGLRSKMPAETKSAEMPATPPAVVRY